MEARSQMRSWMNWKRLGLLSATCYQWCYGCLAVLYSWLGERNYYYYYEILIRNTNKKEIIIIMKY